MPFSDYHTHINRKMRRNLQLIVGKSVPFIFLSTFSSLVFNLLFCNKRHSRLRWYSKNAFTLVDLNNNCKSVTKPNITPFYSALSFPYVFAIQTVRVASAEARYIVFFIVSYILQSPHTSERLWQLCKIALEFIWNSISIGFYITIHWSRNMGYAHV